MKKIIFAIIILLCLGFISCKETNEPTVIDDPTVQEPTNPEEPSNPEKPISEHNIEIMYFRFLKVYKVSSYDGKFEAFHNYPIIECVVGDTIGLDCGLLDWSNLPESVTAKITTSKGDVEFVKLFNNPYAVYSATYPPPPCNFIVHIPNEDMYPNLPEGFLSFNNNLRLQITLKCNPVDGILSVSPDGDVLTAEITCKDQILTKTINVKRE